MYYGAEFVLTRNCRPPSQPLDLPLPSKEDLLQLRYQFPKEKLGYVFTPKYTIVKYLIQIVHMVNLSEIIHIDFNFSYFLIFDMNNFIGNGKHSTGHNIRTRSGSEYNVQAWLLIMTF